MSYRFFVSLSLVVFLAACSSSKVDDSEISTSIPDAITTLPAGPVAGVDGGAITGQAVPGSQQDLEQNIGDTVLFGYDSYDLSGEARSMLENQAQWLNRYPNLSVTVEGHADERGTREYNLALGERRANAIRNYLVALGVQSNRLNVISYGKERPVVFGSDTQSWAQNRRGKTVIN